MEQLTRPGLSRQGGPGYGRVHVEEGWWKEKKKEK